MKVAVSADMRTELVDHVVTWLTKHGHVVDFYGPTQEGAERDWPVVTRQAAEALGQGGCEQAVVICWTGTGAAICANKIAGVRAALCGDAQTARGARKWNHANALALSIRKTTCALADEILEAWFDEPYSDDSWNKTQIARIAELDAQRG